MADATEFAKIMHRAYEENKARAEGLNKLYPEKCNGSKLYKKYKTYFNLYTDDRCAALGRSGIEMGDYFSEAGRYAYDHGYNLDTSAREIRALLGTVSGMKSIVGRVARSKKLLGVMRSILLSMKTICMMTVEQSRYAKPSDFLIGMFTGGSISRYVGRGVSVHFLAMVPGIDTLVEKYAERYVDPMSPTGQKSMQPEFRELAESLPVLKHDAMEACRRFDFRHGNVLDLMDEYYASHRMSLVHGR
jgi:hypothetical protein